MIIALDTMGGDHGPSVIVAGAEIALRRHPDIEFLLYGDRSLIEPLLATRPRLAAAAQTFHTATACATRWIPVSFNGGVFLGLNGLVIKSHGGADNESFATAIKMGYDLARCELLARVNDTLSKRARTAYDMP